MIDERIEHTLKEIEKNLKGVESAKALVNRTVGAFDEVPENLSKCADEFSRISLHMNQLLQLVRDEYGSSTEAFIAEQKRMIEETGREVQELKNHTAEINHSLFGEIDKILEISREKLLELIKLVSDDASRNISLYADSQKELVQSAADAISEMKKAPELCRSEMAIKVNELSEECKRIVSDIGTAVKEYSENLDNLKNDIVKKILLSNMKLSESVTAELADSQEKNRQSAEDTRKVVTAVVNEKIDAGLDTLTQSQNSMKQQLIADLGRMKQTLLDENVSIRDQLSQMKKLIVLNTVVMTIILLVLIVR